MVLACQGEKRAGSGIKAVVFDMDNTLFDFIEAKIAACRAVVRELGGGEVQELLRYFARDPRRFEGHRNIADYMADRGIFDEGRFEEACSLYERAKLNAISLYPGVREALARLKGSGLKLGVATNSSYCNALARLKKTGLIELFDVIVAADSVEEMKPKPDTVRTALELMGVEPGEALMVGDSLGRDIAAGNSLGMVTAHAKYGDRNMDEPPGGIEPDYVLMGVSELLAVLGMDSSTSQPADELVIEGRGTWS